MRTANLHIIKKTTYLPAHAGHARPFDCQMVLELSSVHAHPCMHTHQRAPTTCTHAWHRRKQPASAAATPLRLPLTRHPSISARTPVGVPAVPICACARVARVGASVTHGLQSDLMHANAHAPHIVHPTPALTLHYHLPRAPSHWSAASRAWCCAASGS